MTRWPLGISHLMMSLCMQLWRKNREEKMVEDRRHYRAVVVFSRMEKLVRNYYLFSSDNAHKKLTHTKEGEPMTCVNCTQQHWQKRRTENILPKKRPIWHFSLFTLYKKTEDGHLTCLAPSMNYVVLGCFKRGL